MASATFFLRLLPFVVIFTLSNQAVSSDAVKLVGSWKGTVIVDDLPQPVMIDIADLELGKQVMLIKYTKPRACHLTAEYGGSVKDGEIFYPNTSHGGWCNKIAGGQGGHVKASLTETGKLQYQIKTGKATAESAILGR